MPLQRVFEGRDQSMCVFLGQTHPSLCLQFIQLHGTYLHSDTIGLMLGAV